MENSLNIKILLDDDETAGIITWSKLGWHIQADYCVYMSYQVHLLVKIPYIVVRGYTGRHISNTHTIYSIQYFLIEY